MQGQKYFLAFFMDVLLIETRFWIGFRRVGQKNEYVFQFLLRADRV